MRIATVESGPKRSYLFGAEGSGPLVAIDPGTEVEALVAAARGRKVERIILTSGFGFPPAVTAYQQATGAPIAAHRLLCLELETLGFENLVPLSGGATFAIEETVPSRIIACPGVDPFAIAVLVADAYLFAGETLLVGRPGRLDGPGADPKSLYVSMRILAGLPDGTQLLAGREVGSGCRSTIGAEKQRNAAFTQTAFAAFVDAARAPLPGGAPQRP